MGTTPTIEPWKPSSHGPSKTALLPLDHETAHVGMVSDTEGGDNVVKSSKTLLEAARRNNVAVLHCLMDTSSDPLPTSKGNEKWHALIKPMIAANPDMVVEYKDFVAGDNSNETTFHRNPGHMSALADESVLRFLREMLGVSHLIMCGITTSNAVLGTAIHANDLNFVVTVVREACWDPDEQVHSALLDKVLPVLTWATAVKEAVGYYMDS
ncbi:putative isochorismatase hydrolase protein [Rosellinia necatrix]|uniref:Putative isochorismatase hydrolase protein n=1 Tax=Rosellinia necatrix TaxID=77044 RepID=A0A1W2TTN4_ROSNE|nr:putative isochorismatase hydrolase protein [Rosellinia necatrix]